MPRQKSSDQLQSLRQQHSELEKRIKEAEAKQREKTKADAERRKLLVGGIVLDHLAAKPDNPLATAVRALLASTLTRPADRALFPDLAPLPAPPKTE